MAKNTTVQRPISPEMQECIEACTFCHDACLDTVSYCLEKGGMHAEAAHIRLLLDCAEICQTSANFMLRGSEQHGYTCATCAEICRRCADDCARFGDDPQMQLCADACRACAESCARMAQHARHAA
jgi:hypothetical protein